MTLAKGLGNGVPIGACLTAGKAAPLFKPGNHGSTFGGNPLVCAAAVETLRIIEADGLMKNAVEMGNFIRAGFAKSLAGQAGVKEIRNTGLMIGIELNHPCGDLVQQALDAGLLINVTADTVVRLLPPLIFTREHAQQLIDTLSPLIIAFLGKQATVRPAA
jgi:acetylornithine aminotransferase